ncbi:GBS Bsp-like repeat-containing protein [Paenibacillus sp. B1-33]|uniref:GBS Bsp-like repeat-containing protein n=1 Tax=unclassified Paenibacillus TaxID=185978 RepID=UPI003D2DFDA5
MVKDVKKLFISITIMIVFMIGTNLIYGDKALAQEGQKESQQVFINLSTDAKKNDYIYDADGRLIAAFQADGTYMSYIYDSNGNQINRKKGSQTAQPTINLSALSYEIYIRGIRSNAEQVYFPTWTDRNGQDDIDWIKGTKVSNGVWKATVFFKNHGMETGSYITHIYDGDRMVASTIVNVGFNVKVRSPEKASLKDESYDIYIDGVGSNVNEVRFPTGTEANGQDDLEQPWIRGVNQGNGTWKITIPFKKHNYETGKYITHIYSFDKYGNNMMLGAAEVNVTGGTQYPIETNLSSVSYDIAIYGLDQNTQKVQFPTWTALHDQDDLKWIEGSKVANGVWKATVLYSEHNQEAGSYITHIYADGKFVDGFIVTVRGNNVQLRAPQEVKKSDGSYEIFVEGVPTSINEVRFPTWTDHNGQDDLEHPWMKGEQVKPGVWKIRIPFSKHNNESGTYITHVYTVDPYGNMMAVAGVHVQVMD